MRGAGFGNVFPPAFPASPAFSVVEQVLAFGIGLGVMIFPSFSGWAPRLRLFARLVLSFSRVFSGGWVSFFLMAGSLYYGDAQRGASRGFFAGIGRPRGIPQ